MTPKELKEIDLCRKYGKEMKELHRQVLIRSEEKDSHIMNCESRIKELEHENFRINNLYEMAESLRKKALEEDKVYTHLSTINGEDK